MKKREKPVGTAATAYTFTATGVCTSLITCTMENNRIHNVVFNGGCSGNTQGLSRLLEGMGAREAVTRLQGIRCGTKDTSCPDQFARAMKAFLSKNR
jgi:uncharacterized protein (TIGR03905 family)